ncbi:MAG: iron-sulfur cluster assembly scaffold protein, partial [Chloroflexota bacterium]
AASAVSEFLTGMTIEQARGIDKDAVEDLLGGLPARKGHAAVLVVTVVRRALAKLESERPA